MGNRSKGDIRIARANRFRFVLVEGELSDQNMSELAQVITGALRPVQSHRLPSVPAISDVTEPETFSEPVLRNGQEIEEDSTVDVSSRKSPQPRQYYKPKVLADVDLAGGEVSLDGFVVAKGNPSETSKRFLVVSTWYSEYANTPSVTVDHVYTAYRSLGWTLDMKDVGQPFRDLKGQGWGDYKGRVFTINHVGLGVVKKMDAASAVL